MKVHKYKTLKRRGLKAITVCNLEFSLIKKPSRLGSMWDPKWIPPPECVSNETKINCSTCIDILIEKYQSKIDALELLPKLEEPVNDTDKTLPVV